MASPMNANCQGTCCFKLNDKISKAGNPYKTIELEFDSGYRIEFFVNDDKAYLIQLFEQQKQN